MGEKILWVEGRDKKYLRFVVQPELSVPTFANVLFSLDKKIAILGMSHVKLKVDNN